MNSPELFIALRKILGPLAQLQIDCANAILESCAKHSITDLRQISYVLATGCHECSLEPIRESLGSRQGRFYNVPDPITHQIYYGRGCPTQITLKGNYISFGKLLGIDLVNNPDLALDVHNGAEIGAIGMKDGLFTGVKLDKYFNDKVTDPINARKIINGLDKATHIADFYKIIYEGISLKTT